MYNNNTFYFSRRACVMPERLRVSGARLLYPDGSDAMLHGFNLMFELDSEFAFPRGDTDDMIFQVLPGTNLLRIIVVRWYDRPTWTKGDTRNDCSDGNIQGGRAFSRRCLDQLQQARLHANTKCKFLRTSTTLRIDVAGLSLG